VSTKKLGSGCSFCQQMWIVSDR